MKRITSLLIPLCFFALFIYIFYQGFEKNPSLEFAIIGVGIITGCGMMIGGILLKASTRTLQKTYYWLVGAIFVAVAAALAYRVATFVQEQALFLAFVAFIAGFIGLAMFSLVRSWRRSERNRLLDGQI